LFEQVAVNCPSIRWMGLLALDFREAITSNDRDGMLHWIRTAAQSGFGPLVRLAYSLRKDFKAVIAEVETSWSNGQTEGRSTASRLSSGRCRDALGFLYWVRESYLIRPWRRDLHRKCGRSHFYFALT
jgi:hypothetical protein